VRVGEQKDRQTDLKKLTVASRNFSKATKKVVSTGMTFVEVVFQYTYVRHVRPLTLMWDDNTRGQMAKC
jgi:hypothetical protein